MKPSPVVQALLCIPVDKTRLTVLLNNKTTKQQNNNTTHLQWTKRSPVVQALLCIPVDKTRLTVLLNNKTTIIQLIYSYFYFFKFNNVLFDQYYPVRGLMHINYSMLL